MSPLALRLQRAALARRDVVLRLLGADACHLHAFAFKDEELSFARAVAEKTNVWIWRVSQRAFGGDFVLLDVSEPRAARRRPLAVDLKRGEPVRLGRAGVQMKNAPRIVADIARSGVLPADADPMVLTGSAGAVLAALPALLRATRT